MNEIKLTIKINVTQDKKPSIEISQPDGSKQCITGIGEETSITINIPDRTPSLGDSLIAQPLKPEDYMD